MLDSFLRKLVIAAVAAVAVAAVDAEATVARADSVDSIGPAAGLSKSVKLGLNKSLVIDLPRDARDVLVSNPKIADAVIRTPRRIYLTG
ncbi:MAG: pilus assembly protein CpaC, partial [Bauldia sp.]